MANKVVSINAETAAQAIDSIDQILEQQTIDETSVHKAELAKKELDNAYRIITSDGFRFMQEPFKARTALEKAQACVLKAMSILIDPEDPANHKALNLAAAANLMLFNACQALDSENTTKFIEDAYKATGDALKKVSQANECLEF